MLKTVPWSGIVARDDSYPGQSEVIIPATLAGTHYVHVYTDCNNQEFEHENENNNVTTSSAIVINTPDLVPLDVTVTPNSSSGDTIQVSWNAQNSGTGDIINRNWRDRVYLSPDPVLNPSTAIVLGHDSQSGTVLSNGTYLG